MRDNNLLSTIPHNSFLFANLIFFRARKGFHLSGEVWTYPPILSDANKSRPSSSSSSSQSINQHASVPLLPPYPAQNNVLQQNNNNNNANNNINVGVYERNINNDPNVQFTGEENKKFKVSVSFDR